MKKVIVSGASGFIGSALTCYLLDLGIEVIALCRESSAKHIDNRAKKVSISLENIGDLPRFVKDKDIDCFFHLAWSGMNGPTRGDYTHQLNNVTWTLDALYAAKAIGCKRFVCAGSIMEKETMDVVLSQGTRPGMGYIYGAAKTACHAMAKSIAAKEGIDLIWAGITNAYGVGEVSPRLINSTLRKIIHNEPLQFTAGTQNYDFVYIDDVVRAFYLIGKNGNPFCDYPIGSSNPRPLREFLCEIKDSVGNGCEFNFGDIPYTGISLTLEELNCSRTYYDTGFKAEVSFKDGIVKTMEWLKQQESVQL